MATKHRNLSQLNSPLPSAEEMKFGIVVAEWNPEVTEGLLSGAVHTLRSAGCPEHNIQIKYVPGTFELSLGAQFFAEYTDVDAVIVLGCVIQGDTRHFDFVCQGVTQGVMQLQLQWNMPIAFGVLTTNDLQQALDRSGGRLGNKGDEAAAAAIQMVHLQDEMDTEENARPQGHQLTDSAPIPEAEFQSFETPLFHRQPHKKAGRISSAPQLCTNN